MDHIIEMINDISIKLTKLYTLLLFVNIQLKIMKINTTIRRILIYKPSTIFK